MSVYGLIRLVDSSPKGLMEDFDVKKPKARLQIKNLVRGELDASTSFKKVSTRIYGKTVGEPIKSVCVCVCMEEREEGLMNHTLIILTVR